ncbi:MAG: hypothetical protein E7150_15140 [Bacillus sp. (in: Bacteria)]|nr:hypothetical protein [Bacillus sp. (in: firmicutes)]
MRTVSISYSSEQPDGGKAVFKKQFLGICKLTKSAAEEDLKRKVVALPWNGTEFVIYSDRIS